MIEPATTTVDDSATFVADERVGQINRLSFPGEYFTHAPDSAATCEAAGNRLRLLRTATLLSCGQIGTSIFSVLAVVLTFWVFGSVDVTLIPVISALLMIRLGYMLTRGPEPVLTRFMVRKTMRRVLVDEGKITIGLLAAVFLLSWKITPAEMAVFAVANIALQLMHLAYTRIMLARMAHSSGVSAATALATRTALIIGSGPQAIAAADMILASPELDTRVIGFLDWHRTNLWRYRDIPLVGHPDRLAEFVAGGQVDAILIAVESCDLAASRSILATAEEMGVNSYLLSEIHSPDVAVLRPEFLGGKPALVWRHVKESRTAIFTKLFLDRLGGLIALFMASPFMLITALAIKIDSHGPVFFKQVRCGLNGRQFSLYKFRTMVNDAEGRKDELLDQNEMSGPVFKLRRDPRMTRIGRVLRKYSIDELPQLFNIIKGDMSLVGPRPPLPREVVKYEPWQRRKLSIKPGLTCIWQVSGRNAIGFEEWMRMDLDYIDNWSLWLDAKILARTIPTVLKGTGM
jgi:exopolysaccharide biosynthesis polyprenyl glycosylphosphotransferase